MKCCVILKAKQEFTSVLLCFVIKSCGYFALTEFKKIICYETAELRMWFYNTSDDTSRCLGQVICACYAKSD